MAATYNSNKKEKARVVEVVPPAYEKSSSGCGKPNCNTCPKPTCNTCPKPNCNTCPRPEPCRVQVVQSCPPQACSLPTPRIQCRYVFDKDSDCNKCGDKDDCCDRWTCNAETVIWAAIFIFVIFSVLAYINATTAGNPGYFLFDVVTHFSFVNFILSWIIKDPLTMITPPTKF